MSGEGENTRSVLDGLREFIIIGPTDDDELGSLPIVLPDEDVLTVESVRGLWSRPLTLALLELYKENKSRVGVKFKSENKLFEMLAAKLNEAYKVNFSGKQIANKIRLLAKQFKNYVDDQNETGKGAKKFEFEAEMAEIFGNSRKVHPEVLLSENKETFPSAPMKNPQGTLLVASLPLQPSSQLSSQASFPMSSSSDTADDRDSENSPPASTPSSRKRRASFRASGTAVLDAMRQDRKIFQKEFIQEQKRRNELLEEKNQLLRQLLHNLDS